jgi:DNA processing protein
MAVPGSPLDPRCRGTNRLIREGALLVEDAAQVLEAIDGIIDLKTRLPENFNSNAHDIDSEIENGTEDVRAEILTLLGPSPVEVDELLRQCHCSAPVMGMVLLELDLAGRLERHPGNRVSLLAKVA